MSKATEYVKLADTLFDKVNEEPWHTPDVRQLLMTEAVYLLLRAQIQWEMGL